MSSAARLRQAVLAVAELDRAVDRVAGELDLAEPFADPAVSYFGLRNAVFAIGDTFLELVSPAREDTAAGRLLARRGGDCGYMAMFQVGDLTAARRRAREAGVREVFEVELADIAESHLHPADMRGAIVSISEPHPPPSWRWGGPDWAGRAVTGAILGLTVAVADPAAARERWARIVGNGDLDGIEFVADEAEPGIVAIEVERDGRSRTLTP